VCVGTHRAMFTHCLSDVNLIPLCDRVVLETEFAQLCLWSVNKLRSCLLDIEQLTTQLTTHKVSLALILT